MQKVAPSSSPRSVWSVPPVRPRRAASARSLRVRRPCVLWVDDFVPALAMYRMMMESQGYRVLTASSGQEALETVRTNPVDIVITDYEMPDMDGEAVAMAVKSLCPRLPIVLFSGSTIVPERVQQIVDQCCDKAGSRAELLAAVQNLLSRKDRLTMRRPVATHKAQRDYAVA